jgi:hypothetical protein
MFDANSRNAIKRRQHQNAICNTANRRSALRRLSERRGQVSIQSEQDAQDAPYDTTSNPDANAYRPDANTHSENANSIGVRYDKMQETRHQASGGRKLLTLFRKVNRPNLT